MQVVLLTVMPHEAGTMPRSEMWIQGQGVQDSQTRRNLISFKPVKKVSA